MSLNISPIQWYIGIVKQTSFTEESIDALWSNFFKSYIKLELKILLLLVFWIFLLVSHSILKNLCRELFWTLSMYFNNHLYGHDLNGNDILSRSKSTNDVCCLIRRDFMRKQFWPFSHSFQVDIHILAPHTSPHIEALVSAYYQRELSWLPKI